MLNNFPVEANSSCKQIGAPLYVLFTHIYIYIHTSKITLPIQTQKKLHQQHVSNVPMYVNFSEKKLTIIKIATNHVDNNKLMQCIYFHLSIHHVF